MEKVSKNTLEKIFDIIKVHPWLVNKSNAVLSLICNDCSCSQHQDLLVDLIERVCYLSYSKYVECLKELVLEIVTDPNLKDYETQIVAMCADSSSDSSQYILQDSKVFFEEYGWYDHVLTNHCFHALREYKKNTKLKNIIIIDEYIGSGDTASKRVARVQSDFSSIGVEVNVNVKVVAASSCGLNYLDSKGVNASAVIVLKKGIDDYYNRDIVNSKLAMMLQIEDILLEEYKKIEMPTLGFENTQSLYYRENGNTPNNVFPIFWWPFYHDGKRRDTIFTRAML